MRAFAYITSHRHCIILHLHCYLFVVFSLVFFLSLSFSKCISISIEHGGGVNVHNAYEKILKILCTYRKAYIENTITTDNTEKSIHVQSCCVHQFLFLLSFTKIRKRKKFPSLLTVFINMFSFMAPI